MELLKYAIEDLKDVRAKNIRVFETKNNNPFYSYIVLATVFSGRQMDAYAGKIYKTALEKGFEVRGIEGRSGSTWVLVDLNDVVVNVFTEEERQKYDLDKLYAMLPEIEVK